MRHIARVQHPGKIAIHRHHRRIDPGLVRRHGGRGVILSQRPDDASAIAQVGSRVFVFAAELGDGGRGDVVELVAGGEEGTEVEGGEDRSFGYNGWTLEGEVFAWT